MQVVGLVAERRRGVERQDPLRSPARGRGPRSSSIERARSSGAGGDGRRSEQHLRSASASTRFRSRNVGAVDLHVEGVAASRGAAVPSRSRIAPRAAGSTTVRASDDRRCGTQGVPHDLELEQAHDERAEDERDPSEENADAFRRHERPRPGPAADSKTGRLTSTLRELHPKRRPGIARDHEDGDGARSRRP